MFTNNNTQAFFALVKAGLWEQNVRLSGFDIIDFGEVLNFAEEQSVVGLVAAGLEHVVDIKVPKEDLLQFVGQTLQLEQQNLSMNHFIGLILEKLKSFGVESVLIKGQGIAQCYERPLWRASGDVDLLLNKDNYEKGKLYLKNLSETKPEEYSFNKEYSTTIDGWSLELHGSLRSGLSSSFNKGVDAVQKEICNNHHVRYWDVEGVSVPLPAENEDVIVVFTHYIKHFYKGGLGIRQICDWCRLLWTYRETIDISMLKTRLSQLNLLTEWKAFSAFAVEYLGMPVSAMPLYCSEKKWSRKAEKISRFLMEVGNFGHNVENGTYMKFPFIIRKTISMGKRVNALLQHSKIFPTKTLLYLPHVLLTGLKSAIKGE